MASVEQSDVSSAHPDSTVYFLNIQKTIDEDSLRDICQKFGQILDMKVMKPDTKEPAFGHITFQSPAVADIFVKRMNGASIDDNSGDNNARLFVANIPKGLTKEKIFQILNSDALRDLTVYSLKDQPKLAMLEYDTPQDALLAKDFILNVRELKNKGVVIEWGDPKPVAEVTDINEMNLHVRNAKMTAEILKGLCMSIDPKAEILNKIQDCAIIRFETKELASQALAKFNEGEFYGSRLRICYAKSATYIVKEKAILKLQEKRRTEKILKVFIPARRIVLLNVPLSSEKNDVNRALHNLTAGVADVTQEGPLGTWVVMYHSSEATKGAIKMLSTKGTRVLEKSIHLMIDDVDMDGSQPKLAQESFILNDALTQNGDKSTTTTVAGQMLNLAVGGKRKAEESKKPPTPSKKPPTPSKKPPTPSKKLPTPSKKEEDGTGGASGGLVGRLGNSATM